MDEVIKLILQVKGQAEAKELSKEILAAEKEIAKLGRTLQTTDPAMIAKGTHLKALSDRHRELMDQFGKTSGGTRNMGMAILEGSRALEDLQYGLNGVINNVPGFVAAMGGSAGIAGAVSVVAVGANLLYQNWDSLQTLFDMGGTKTEAERMEELGKQTKRTAEETAIYNRYKKQEADRQKADSGVSEATQQNESAVLKAITEAQTQGGEVSGAVAGIMMQSGMFKDADADAKIKAYRDQGFKDAADALQKQEDTRRQDEALTAAKNLVGGAVNDPQMRKTLAGYVRQNPTAFQDGLLGDLENADPAEREKQERLERQGEARANQLVKEAEERKRFNAETDQLNAQGLDNQERYYELMAKAKEDSNREAADLNAQGLENQRLTFEAMEKDRIAFANRQIAIAARAQGERDAQNGNTAARAGGLVGRIADASGLADPATMQLFNARQAGMAKLTDANNIRKWSKMTVEEREAAIGKVNDRADRQTEDQLSREMLRRGLTRSPTEARAAAAQLVNQARGNVNGATGDPMTVAAEKNAKTSEQLLAAVVELKRGIPVIMGP